MYGWHHEKTSLLGYGKCLKILNTKVSDKISVDQDQTAPERAV